MKYKAYILIKVLEVCNRRMLYWGVKTEGHWRGDDIT
jgi:hypothetical protein